MGLQKRLLEQGAAHDFTIGAGNPLLGKRVTVTWLRAWGGKPVGHQLTGTLVETFTPNGRAMLGAIKLDSGVIREAPWSKRYLKIEVIQ